MAARTTAVALAALVAAACTGNIFSPLPGSGSGPAVSAPAPPPPSGIAPSGVDPSSPDAMDPPVAPGWLNPRIRRLTGAEYDATVQALLAVTAAPSAAFPTEVRQGGFTRNDAQIV